LEGEKFFQKVEFGIGLVVGIVFLLVGGLFGVFNKFIGGWQFGRRM